jgi:hypothetical protein
VAKITGGKKFNAAMRDLSRKLSRGDVRLRVGFLEKATYPNGTPVAMIAAINEYGRPPVQPPRPFFRNMITAKKDEWPAAVAGVMKANDLDIAKTLDIVGAAIAGQLRQSIVDLVSPPLAPSTIRRKGFDKPLIDTSVMLKSIDHDVKT